MHVVRPVGESALLLEWAGIPESLASRKARAVAAHLERHPPDGLRDWTLGARSLLVSFDPLHGDGSAIARSAAIWENDFAAIPEGRLHEVPVCYGGAGGVDLEELAAERAISPETFVERHCASEYRVAFLASRPGSPISPAFPRRSRRRGCRRRACTFPAAPSRSGRLHRDLSRVRPGDGDSLRTPAGLFDPRQIPRALRAR
jgi:allophanate hydrolase subunit 1